MADSVPPRPETFGLTQDRIHFFEMRQEDSSTLPLVLAWVTFIALCPFLPWGFVMKNTAYFWPVMLVGYLPGLVLGLALNKFRSAFLSHRQESHKDYGKYVSYKKACVEYALIRQEEERCERERQQAQQTEINRKKRLNEEWWRSLDGNSFEKELADFLRHKGFAVRWLGGSGDGGIDLVIASAGKRIIVQCKAHRRFISPGAVRDLYGTLLHEKADEGWLVTTSGFYSGARAFAQDKPIRLLTICEVLSM